MTTDTDKCLKPKSFGVSTFIQSRYMFESKKMFFFLNSYIILRLFLTKHALTKESNTNMCVCGGAEKINQGNTLFCFVVFNLY